jgi:hypothetical protein
MHIGGRSFLCQVARYAGCHILALCVGRDREYPKGHRANGITAGIAARFLAEHRKMLRKILAILSLSALLLASVPALAESFAASDLPACCNTAYCPLRHRQARDLNRDKMLCGAAGQMTQNECSMRACDMAPNPAVGTPLFVLAAPPAIAYRVETVRAPLATSLFFSTHLNLPSTPPPRALPS